MAYSIFCTALAYLPAVFLFMGLAMYLSETLEGVTRSNAITVGIVCMITMSTFMWTAVACLALGASFHPLGLMAAVMSPCIIVYEM